MIISTSSCDIHLTPDIDALVHDRMHVSLAAFVGKIVSLDVRLRQVSRPRGTADCAATVHVRLHGGREIVVEGVDKYVSAAVRRAAHHARWAIRRQVGRQTAPRARRVRDLLRESGLVAARSA